MSNLHELMYIFLDNGLMTTPKHRILSFVFTFLYINKSLLIPHVIIRFYAEINEVCREAIRQWLSFLGSCTVKLARFST